MLGWLHHARYARIRAWCGARVHIPVRLCVGVSCCVDESIACAREQVLYFLFFFTQRVRH